MNLSHPRFPVPVHRFRSSPMSNSQYDPSSSHSSWHTDVPSSSNASMTDYAMPSSQYTWNGQETSVWSSSYNNFDSHSEHNHAPSDASFSSGPAQPSPSRSQQPHHVSHSHSHSHSQSPPVQQQHAHQSKSFASTLFPTGTFSYNSLASSTTTNGPSSSCIVDERPKFAPASWEGHDLYRIGGDLDQDPHSPPPPSNPQPRHANSSAAVDPCSPSSPPRSPPPPIVKKEEEPDDGFVFELSSNSTQQTFAPMTEVPLRATHASKSQRKLMTSFRLDPFATQNGIRANTDNKNWLGEEIGPHTEEPQLIEFQIELTVPLISPSLTNSPLPSFEDPADFFSSAPRASGSSTSRPMLPIPANSPLTQYLRGVGQPSNQLPSAASSHQIFPPTPPQVHPPTHTSIHTSSNNSLLYPYQDHDLDDDDHWMGNDAAPFHYSPTSTNSSRAMDMSSQGTGPGTGTASPGAAFEAVMTPAQSLQWQMGFQAGDPSCLDYPNGVTTSSESSSPSYHSTALSHLAIGHRRSPSRGKGAITNSPQGPAFSSFQFISPYNACCGLKSNLNSPSYCL